MKEMLGIYKAIMKETSNKYEVNMKEVRREVNEL